MKEHKYIVLGSAPARGKQVNDLMKACGLGGEGAFVQSAETVTLKINSGDVDKVTNILKQAYQEKLGWHDVSVSAI